MVTCTPGSYQQGERDHICSELFSIARLRWLSLCLPSLPSLSCSFSLSFFPNIASLILLLFGAWPLVFTFSFGISSAPDRIRFLVSSTWRKIFPNYKSYLISLLFHARNVPRGKQSVLRLIVGSELWPGLRAQVDVPVYLRAGIQGLCQGQCKNSPEYLNHLLLHDWGGSSFLSSSFVEGLGP